MNVGIWKPSLWVSHLPFGPVINWINLRHSILPLILRLPTIALHRPMKATPYQFVTSFWKNTNKRVDFLRDKFSKNCVFLSRISFTVGAGWSNFLFSFICLIFLSRISFTVGAGWLVEFYCAVRMFAFPGHPRESGFHQTFQWLLKTDRKLICKTKCIWKYSFFNPFLTGDGWRKLS